MIVPDELAGGAGFLAQTWDMHDSATEHVTLIRVAPDSGPAALVFTTVGCLGQIGMNRGRDRGWHQQPHGRQRADRCHLAVRRAQSAGSDVDRGGVVGGFGG